MSAYADYQHALGEDDFPDDEPTFARGGVTRQHVARKDLSCDACGCGRGIRKGERYEVTAGLDEDGAFSTWRTCLVLPQGCLEAREREVRLEAEPELPFPPPPRRPAPHRSDFDDIPF